MHRLISGPARTRWRRFSGRVSAVVILLPASLLALIVVPRPVAPVDIPLPHIDWEAWGRHQRSTMELVASARSNGLSYSVRVVGELIVRWGRAEYQRDAEQLRQLRGRLDASVERALEAEGSSSLMALRAVQCESFVNVAVRERGKPPKARESETPSEQSSPPTAWIELGGRLARRSSDSAWVLAATKPELWAACLVRWNALTGLDEHVALAPAPEAIQLLFHLRYRASADAPVEHRVARWMEMIASLEPYDSEYPAAYARGIGFYLLSDYAAAFAEFRRHLQRHPTGPWTLRARNHAQASASALGGAEG